MEIRVLFFVLFFSGLSTYAVAQIHLGLSVGPNQSYWQWELNALKHDLGFEPAWGLRTAVFGEWQLSPVWAVRAEVGAQIKANQMRKRLLFETDILAGNFNGTIFIFREHYQYWEGSLLAQVSPLKKMRSLYLLAGGTLGRLQYGWKTSRGSEAGNKFKNKSVVDVNDGNWNRMAVAADLGIGGNIPLDAHSKLKLEARFQYNFSNLAQSNDVDARVQSLLLTVGYLHRL